MQTLSKNIFLTASITAASIFLHAGMPASAKEQAQRSTAELRNLKKQGMLFYKTKKPNVHAMQKFAEDAIAKYPNEALFHTLRGKALADRKKREEAIAEYTTALKLKPDVDTYADRSYTYRCLGEDGKAVEDLQQIVKLAPTTRHYVWLCDRLMQRGHIDEAISLMLKGLTLSNKEPDMTERNEAKERAYDTLGRCYLALNKTDQALKYFNLGLEMFPGFTAACKKHDQSAIIKAVGGGTDQLLRRGEAYEKLGRLNEAAADYEIVVKIAPKSFEYRRSLLRLYRKTNQNDKALKLVSQMLIEDDSPDLYYKRADIYKKLGKTELAKVDEERARKIEYGIMGTMKLR